MKRADPDLAAVPLNLLALALVAADPAPDSNGPDDQKYDFSVAARETFDNWGVIAGADPGTATLSKLQVSGTLRGDRFGFAGWSAHAQIYRFDGQSLSRRLGDIQTTDNLEAPPVTRLFEAWLTKQWGEKNRSVALRAGLLDLNSQFDSIDSAALFLNSSHGIAPDLSHSGRNGPSIYPVTAPGATLTFVRSEQATIRFGLFDGVAGNPARPRSFLAETLRAGNGLLGIAQVDYQLGKDSSLEAGAWSYSASSVAPDGRSGHDSGIYGSVQSTLGLAPRLRGWVRAGIANGRVQNVGGYVGFGLAQTGTLPDRPRDRLGIALAHAVIGPEFAAVGSLHRAETSVEATYQVRFTDRIALQPDAQWIIHPAGVAKAPNALGVGLRMILSTGYPRKPVATDPTDPTVPPDG